MLDTISICRRLREKDIGIYFEKENLNTLNLNSEMLLALYAMFAQSESESISANVKNGKRMRYKAGNVGYNFNMVYGYKQDEFMKYSGKFEFNNKIICGQCGTKYRRTMWITKKNEKQYKKRLRICK